MRYNILHISPNFNLASGVSKHVFTLLTSEELKKEFNPYFVTNGGDALFKLDKAEVNYSIMDFKIDKLIHFDLFRNTKQLKNFCVEKEIHLIHSHHRYPEYLSNTIKKSVGTKTVMTAHDFVHGLKYFSYKSDRVIAISNAVADHLSKKFKVSSEKTDVLYNCIFREGNEAHDKEKIREKLEIPSNKKILLYSGRFIKKKGIKSLLNAFKSLRKYNSGIILIMVGGYKESLTINNNHEENFMIFQPQEDMMEFYAISDLVILPSFTEGLGYTMLEAGQNKIPFIGSRAGGISEFIEDKVNGFLFEPGNSNDLASKIKFVLEHPDEAEKSAIKLSEKVNRLCNCEDYFTKLSDIYHQLLDDR